MKQKKKLTQTTVFRLFILVILILLLQGIIMEERLAVKKEQVKERTVMTALLDGLQWQLDVTWRVICYPIMDFREITSQKGKILL